MGYWRGPVIERFFLKVLKLDNGCWLWTGCRTGNDNRYGQFERQRAHVWSYNTCKVYLCVNPEHLEPVTHQVNMDRAKLVVCRRGHPRNRDSQGRCRDCRKVTGQ